MKKTKTNKKLLQTGQPANMLLLGVVAGLMVVIAAFTLVASHAATVNYFDNSYLTVKPLKVAATLDRKNPNYALMTADGAGYTQGLLYGTGFTITDKTATSYQVKYTTPTQGVGFYESSGGLTPGQSVKLHTYINPSKADGTYSGSAIISYYAPDKGAWVDGPAVNYTITLVSWQYTDYMTVKPLKVTTVLSRGSADQSGGLIFGSGFTINNIAAGGFEVAYNQPTQGQGFYTSSGGLTPGQTFKDQSYVNATKANGTYAGSAVIKFYAPDQQAWLTGPTVNYSLSLVDSYYTDFLSVTPANVSVTLSRANADASGLVHGSGIKITNIKSGGFEVVYNQPTQGQGFATSSGGLTPGQVVTDQTYVNANKPNGTYTGSAVIKYYDPGQQAWEPGPTVNYTITLTD